MKFDADDFLAATGSMLDQWAHQCHAASIALVKSGALGECRVARGACKGVGGQHSWVVLGMDCYDPQATIVDPTLWSYDETVEGIWIGTMQDDRHFPHGRGSIWEWGRPNEAEDEPLYLDESELSSKAKDFLDLLGPLDIEGWRCLAHAPVQDWPSDEIIAAMYRHPQISGWIPIDIVGMATLENPSGLYLKGE